MALADLLGLDWRLVANIHSDVRIGWNCDEFTFFVVDSSCCMIDVSNSCRIIRIAHIAMVYEVDVVRPRDVRCVTINLSTYLIPTTLQPY